MMQGGGDDDAVMCDIVYVVETSDSLAQLTQNAAAVAFASCRYSDADAELLVSY